MKPDAPELTAEQIKNWRTALLGMLGPHALCMPIEQIQRMRDKMQEWANGGVGASECCNKLISQHPNGEARDAATEQGKDEG